MYYALKYLDNSTTDEEIRTIDMTEEFWNELKEIYEAGEIINININGLPTKGKSTIGGEIATYIVEKLIHKSISIHNIARDQQEFSKMMRDPKLNNTCILIDEWNELESTGENATIEDYIKKLQDRPKIEESIEGGISKVEITDIRTITDNQINNLYKELLSSKVQDKDLLNILAREENMQKLKFRLVMQGTIRNKEGEILGEIKHIGQKTLKETLTDLKKICTEGTEIKENYERLRNSLKEKEYIFSWRKDGRLSKVSLTMIFLKEK